MADWFVKIVFFLHTPHLLLVFLLDHLLFTLLLIVLRSELNVDQLTDGVHHLATYLEHSSVFL